VGQLPFSIEARVDRRIEELDEKIFPYLKPEGESVAIKQLLEQAIGWLNADISVSESMIAHNTKHALSVLGALQIDVSQKHLMMGAVAFLHDADVSWNHFRIAAETTGNSPLAWMLTAYLHLCRDEFGQAKEIYARVLALLGNSSDCALLGRVHTNMGIALFRSIKRLWGIGKKYSTILVHFKAALDAFQKHEDRTRLAIRHLNYAYVSEALGKQSTSRLWRRTYLIRQLSLQQSLEHYLKAERIAKDLDTKSLLSLIFTDLSFYFSYGSSKDDAKSIAYLSKALTVERQLGRKNKIADIQGGMGVSELARRNNAAACIHLSASYNLYKQLGNDAVLKTIRKFMKKAGCAPPP
jgi:tetratricopeptide (TPR) repeat protein